MVCVNPSQKLFAGPRPSKPSPTKVASGWDKKLVSFLFLDLFKVIPLVPNKHVKEVPLKGNLRDSWQGPWVIPLVSG